MSKFYSVYPNENFFEKSAQAIIENSFDKSNIAQFSKTQIWVPSSRIAQSLKDEITKQLGNFAILPEIKTISFDDSDIQSVQFYNSDSDFLDQEFLSPASKLLYFARAIHLAMPDWTFQQAFAESTSLVKLHQDLQNYDISLDQLSEAVPFELATHWEKNLHIVKAVFAYYDQFLEETNKQDKYTFQNKLIELYIKRYSQKDCYDNVYAVGFNDTTSLGKKVLQKITELENGFFIFPYINKDNFKVDTLETTNYQYAVHELCKLLGVHAENLSYLGMRNPHMEFLNMVFLPFHQTHRWFEEQSEYNKINNLTIINSEDLLAEAKTIALTMREALETKDKTCALISPNRSLAQHVIQQLKRWNINVNDSAGIALNATLKGQLSLNLLNMILEDFSVESIIPVVTNPQVDKSFKFDFETSKKQFIELGVIGSNVDSSLKAIENKIKQNLPWQNRKEPEDKVNAALNILRLLHNSTAAINPADEKTLAQWSLMHLDLLLEYVTADSLFDEEDGKVLAEVFAELKQTESISKVNLKTYFQTFNLMLEQTMVRQTNNLHPRLFVWGSPEARLQKIDRVIISDFNDATWPGKIKSSLWLNPSIRSQLNMPDVSVSVGLNANDLYNQLMADEVIITRSKKDEQGETVPSRFLIRLENAMTKDSYSNAISKGEYYNKLSDKLEKTKVSEYLCLNKTDSVLELEKNQKIPDEISASSVKDLANCPYKFYLSKVMYLQELEDVKDVSPNLWGTVVHLMLEGFFAGLSQYGVDKLQMPLDKSNKQLYISRFNTIINAILNQINSNIIDLSWRTKLENIANEFVDLTLKSDSEVTYTEREFKANGFKAILDRVDTDIINDQKALRIIDYKTGTPPTRSNMIEFKDPQLIVESYILEKNGLKVEDLNYWHVKGYSNKAIDVKQIANSSKSKLSFEEVKQQSYEMLENLKDEFSKTNAKFYPYAQGTAKQKELACKYCPYSGICRKFGL